MGDISSKTVREQIARKARADEIAEMKLRIEALEVAVERLQIQLKRETPALLKRGK